MTDVRKILWIFCAALTLVYGGYNLTRSMLGPKQGEDFAQYYVASRLLCEHEAMTMYDTGALYQEKAKSYGVHPISYNKSTDQVMTYAYPPFVAFLMMPFTAFSYDFSRCIFFLLSLMCSWGAVLLFFSDRSLDKRKDITSLGMMAALLFFPNYYSFYMGQINSLVFFACAFALFLIRKKAQISAGFFIALAISIKIFPLILIPLFLIKKQYRLLLSTLAFLILFIGISLTQCDWNLYVTFFTQVLPDQFSGGPWIRNQGFIGFFSRLLTSNEYVKFLGDYPHWAYGFSLGCSLLVLGATFFYTWKNQASYEIQYGVYFVAALLVLAKSWEHYGMFLLFSYLYLVEYLIYEHFSKRVLFLILVSFCIWAFIQTSGNECYQLPKNVFVTLMCSLKFFATLLLWFCHLSVLKKMLNQPVTFQKGDPHE